MGVKVLLPQLPGIIPVSVFAGSGYRAGKMVQCSGQARRPRQPDAHPFAGTSAQVNVIGPCPFIQNGKRLFRVIPQERPDSKLAGKAAGQLTNKLAGEPGITQGIALNIPANRP